MNYIDLIILIIVVFTAYRWYKIGFVKTLFLVAGIVVGISIGLLIAPIAMRQFKSEQIKFIAMLLSIGGCTIAIGYLAELAGHHINIRIQKPQLQSLNSATGAVFSLFISLGVIWISAGLIAASPIISLNRQIQDSGVIQFMNKNLPATPVVIGRLGALIAPLDFPRVFIGTPPKLADPVIPAGSDILKSAIQKAGLSTVKVESVGCGVISSGSGFVAGDGLIATNAHVVSGANSVTIIDTNSTFPAKVVYFDPSMDIAILRTEVLKAPVLNISTKIYSRGQEAVGLGFPGGGDFRAEPVGISRSLKSRGLDIYGEKPVEREVYEFIGRVVQGNSGGPIVLADGTVIGMVFASAQNDPGFGYGLNGQEIASALAGISPNEVSTQKCY